MSRNFQTVKKALNLIGAINIPQLSALRILLGCSLVFGAASLWQTNLFLEIVSMAFLGFTLGRFFNITRRFVAFIGSVWILAVLLDPFLWNLMYFSLAPMPYNLAFWLSLTGNSLVLALFILSLLLGRDLEKINGGS